MGALSMRIEGGGSRRQSRAAVYAQANKMHQPVVSAAARLETSDFDDYVFRPIRESQVSREMCSRYFADLHKYAETDVVIIGAGSAGLACAYELSKHPEVSVALVEQAVAPGGGAWLGGQLFSAMVVRKPAHALLDELNVPYDDVCDDYVVIKHAALFTSTLLSKVLAAPNIKLFNATAVEDLIVKPMKNVDTDIEMWPGPHGHMPTSHVAGVVTNWSLVSQNHETQSCMDPNTLEARVVVCATGHDGPMGATGVKRLQQLGLIENLPGMGALDMNSAEDAVVKHTREVYPGMIIAGMEVAEVDGCPRMGPTFGGMLVSGSKAAALALDVVARFQDASTMRVEAADDDLEPAFDSFDDDEPGYHIPEEILHL